MPVLINQFNLHETIMLIQTFRYQLHSNVIQTRTEDIKSIPIPLAQYSQKSQFKLSHISNPNPNRKKRKKSIPNSYKPQHVFQFRFYLFSSSFLRTSELIVEDQQKDGNARADSLSATIFFIICFQDMFPYLSIMFTRSTKIQKHVIIKIKIHSHDFFSNSFFQFPHLYLSLFITLAPSTKYMNKYINNNNKNKKIKLTQYIGFALYTFDW